MYAIGDFSRITGITIKALRLYHEKGLIIPRSVDPETGYRYYDARNIEQARCIVYLKQMTFSLEEIAQMMQSFEDDSDILDFLENRRESINQKIKQMQQAKISIDEIIRREKEAVQMSANSEFEVEEKNLDTCLVAGIRWKGKYDECGDKFAALYKEMGRLSCGKPMSLYYDDGYKEDDADIETCLPVRKGKSVQGIEVKTLPGGPALTIIHKGPYDQIGRSYEKIAAYARKRKLKVKAPCREVYVKGPGMVFKGNPKNYLTEIQMLIDA